MSLTAATGASVKMIAKVGTEIVRITDVRNTPTLGIVPGYTKSTAGPWAAGTPVVFGVPSDFIGLAGPEGLSFSIAGAITGPGGAGTIPVVDTTIFISGPAAIAMTLALPSVDGSQTLDIFNSTAFAHTVTATGNPGTSDLFTFVAALGGRITLKATFGVWSVVGAQGVVIS